MQKTSCKELRLINLAEGEDYRPVLERYQFDIVSKSSKFEDQEYIEVVFHTPGHLKHFCQAILHRIDFQLVLKPNQSVPLHLYSLYAPNLTSVEISRLRASMPSLAAIRGLPRKETHYQQSYIVECTQEEDLEIAIRLVPKLRAASFKYRVLCHKAISWSEGLIAAYRGLVLFGVRPDVVCQIIGPTSISRRDKWLVLYGDSIDEWKHRLDSNLAEASCYFSRITDEPEHLIKRFQFRIDHADKLEYYYRFARTIDYKAIQPIWSIAESL